MELDLSGIPSSQVFLRKDKVPRGRNNKNQNKVIDEARKEHFRKASKLFCESVVKAFVEQFEHLKKKGNHVRSDKPKKRINEKRVGLWWRKAWDIIEAKYDGIPGHVLLYGHLPDKNNWQRRLPLEELDEMPFRTLQRMFLEMDNGNGWYLIEESDPKKSDLIYLALYSEYPTEEVCANFNKEGALWHGNNVLPPRPASNVSVPKTEKKIPKAGTEKDALVGEKSQVPTPVKAWHGGGSGQMYGEMELDGLIGHETGVPKPSPDNGNTTQ